MEESRKQYYTVSEITSLIRNMLESRFPDISIKGEISNFRPSSTGHYYFSLKDKDSLISVVMFKSRIYNLGFKPEDGMVVIARGSISVYPKRGTYQLICESLERAGEGDILALLEERKRRLAAEGLFDRERKKSIPMIPSTIAVVTSPTGAAIKDILRVLKRRNTGINLNILPTPVQGEEAAEAIARQIRIANTFGLGDVVIVTRGGGSLEDLLPFYDERVVRAIAESDIPVISAVGHEIDVTLSDLAADRRAPTPSAAAEMVTAAREEIVRRVSDLYEQLTYQMKMKIDKLRLKLENLSPENLSHWISSMLERNLFALDDLTEQIVNETSKMVTDIRHRLEIATNSIKSYSPREILKRGYAAITSYRTGKLIKRADEVEISENLDIRLYRGRLDVSVTEVYTDEEL